MDDILVDKWSKSFDWNAEFTIRDTAENCELFLVKLLLEMK